MQGRNVRALLFTGLMFKIVRVAIVHSQLAVDDRNCVDAGCLNYHGSFYDDHDDDNELT